MEKYEIHVMDDDGRTDLILAAIHLNDNAAVRSGQKIAHGHKFEVWRGMDCIYGTQGAIVIALTASNPPNSLQDFS
jgi:hypothetical protein